MGQLRQSGAIFLSASVPNAAQKHFMGEGDIAAITAAVSALLYVTLGRRPLVWGGHPAITPMVWAYAEALDINYEKWVTLYQSNFFKDEFPEENARFANVMFTEAIDGNRDASLTHMRKRMLSEHEFGAAVFIGGMGGILDEYEIFKEFAPRAKLLPIVSTGGAAEKLGELLLVSDDFRNELDYVDLFFKKLEINPDDRRS